MRRCLNHNQRRVSLAARSGMPEICARGLSYAAGRLLVFGWVLLSGMSLPASAVDWSTVFQEEVGSFRQEADAFRREVGTIGPRTATLPTQHTPGSAGKRSVANGTQQLAPSFSPGTSNVQLTGFGKACSCDGTGCDSPSCPFPQAPCVDCPRVTTAAPYFNINLFGALKLDMLFNQTRPIAPGTPFFLAPDSVNGFSESTFDMHARQSTLGAAMVGPKFGGFQSGGTVIAMFYNDAIIVDEYGLLPLQAYGELTNDRWRISAGLQFDVFSPGIPTILPFSALSGSGNAGNSFRGQLRAERFFRPSSDRQLTLQFALSEPIPTTIDGAFRLSEDHGWPNIESRVALGLGEVQGVGPLAKRPIEFGLSGIVGQLRTTLLTTRQEITDVWGVNFDGYWRVSERCGFAGEIFSGQAIGTYNAGVLQNVNLVSFKGIEASGGWLETFLYWTPRVHSHFGYGIDDPKDADVSPLGRTRNETYFANALWDVNPTFRLGFEFTYRETGYKTLPSNQGTGFHTQLQWTF